MEFRFFWAGLVFMVTTGYTFRTIGWQAHKVFQHSSHGIAPGQPGFIRSRPPYSAPMYCLITCYCWPNAGWPFFCFGANPENLAQFGTTHLLERFAVRHLSWFSPTANRCSIHPPFLVAGSLPVFYLVHAANDGNKNTDRTEMAQGSLPRYWFFRITDSTVFGEYFFGLN